MTDNMKGCLWACAVTLPLFIGVGWVADVITRGLMALVLFPEHAEEIASGPSLLLNMLPVMLVMWAVTSLMCIGLAALGLGAHRMPQVPPPPPFPEMKEKDE